MTAQDKAVGKSPVKYDFAVTPNGEIPIKSYLVIELPDALKIPTDAASIARFTSSCGENLKGFTNSAIACEVINSGKQIKITNGFLSAATTTYISSSGLWPPELTFTLNGFTNAILQGAYGPFKVTIFNQSDVVIYTWMSLTDPTLQLTGYVKGTCTVESVTVSDNDVRIYARPASYTFKVRCSNVMKPNFGIRITFPADFTIVDQTKCNFGGYTASYSCTTAASAR